MFLQPPQLNFIHRQPVAQLKPLIFNYFHLLENQNLIVDFSSFFQYFFLFFHLLLSVTVFIVMLVNNNNNNNNKSCMWKPSLNSIFTVRVSFLPPGGQNQVVQLQCWEDRNLWNTALKNIKLFHYLNVRTFLQQQMLFKIKLQVGVYKYGYEKTNN